MIQRLKRPNGRGPLGPSGFVDPESDGESFQAGYMAAAREALNSDDKLRRIERIASSASWRNRCGVTAWFCAEILTVINIDGMDIGPLADESTDCSCGPTSEPVWDPGPNPHGSAVIAGGGMPWGFREVGKP